MKDSDSKSSETGAELEMGRSTPLSWKQNKTKKKKKGKEDSAVMNFHHNNLSCGYTTAEQFPCRMLHVDPLRWPLMNSHRHEFKLFPRNLMTCRMLLDRWLLSFYILYQTFMRMDSTYLAHFNAFGFRIFRNFFGTMPPGYPQNLPILLWFII